MQNPKPLLIILAVVLAALGLFLFLKSEVVPEDKSFDPRKQAPNAETDARAPEIDREMAQRCHEDAKASPERKAFFRTMTDVGDKLVMTTFGIAVCLVLLWWRLWGIALVWAIVLIGAVLLNTELKDTFQRVRPSTTHMKSFSFPSGHSMNALSDFGMLAYLLVLGVRTRWLRNLVIAALGTLVLLIGFSRIYLTDHWLTDVLGGYSLATVWLGSWILVIEIVRRRRAPVPAEAPPPAQLEKV